MELEFHLYIQGWTEKETIVISRSFFKKIPLFINDSCQCAISIHKSLTNTYHSVLKLSQKN